MDVSAKPAYVPPVAAAGSSTHLQAQASAETPALPRVRIVVQDAAAAPSLKAAFPRIVNALTGAMTSVSLEGVRRAVPLASTPVLRPRGRPDTEVHGPRVDQTQAAMDRALACAMKESALAINACNAIDQANDLCAAEKIGSYIATDGRLQACIAATPVPALSSMAGQLLASARARLHEGHNLLLDFQRMAPVEDQADDIASVTLAALEAIEQARLAPDDRHRACQALAARFVQARDELFSRCPLAEIESGVQLLTAQTKVRWALQPPA